MERTASGYRYLSPIGHPPLRMPFRQALLFLPALLLRSEIFVSPIFCLDLPWCRPRVLPACPLASSRVTSKSCWPTLCSPLFHCSLDGILEEFHSVACPSISSPSLQSDTRTHTIHTHSHTLA